MDGYLSRNPLKNSKTLLRQYLGSLEVRGRTLANILSRRKKEVLQKQRICSSVSDLFSSFVVSFSNFLEVGLKVTIASHRPVVLFRSLIYDYRLLVAKVAMANRFFLLHVAR